MSLTGAPVIVLGTFRGGTSCLATALVAMGLYMGEPNAFQKANEFNKSGFWELQDLQALNAKALLVYGMGYLGADHMHEDWLARPETGHFVAEIRAILERHFAGKEHWGWKEPATTSLFPLYMHVLNQESLGPIFPIMVRHPLSVASSRKRQFLIKNADAASNAHSLLPPDDQRALGMWVDYMLTNLIQSRNYPRVMVSYEDLMEQPRANLEKAASIMPWKPTPEQIQAAVDTINPEWSHSRFAPTDLDPWPSIVSRTYALCLEAASDPQGLNDGRYDATVDRLWEEWQVTTNMARSLQMPAGQMIVTWQENGEVQHYTEPFTPTGSWQKLRVAVKGRVGGSVQVTLYQMPCQIWIRKAVWVVGDQTVPAALMAGPGGILERPGTLRLTSFGPGALTVKIPAGEGEPVLDIDFLLTFDITSVSAAAVAAKVRLDAVRRASPADSR